MKILHTVESYHPALGGMQEVVKQLSERLARLGHEVTVATSKDPGRLKPVINGVRIADFAVSGNAVRGFWGDVAYYVEFLLQSDFDIVANFAAQQWATDILLPILDRIRGKKVFVPTGFSGLYLKEYAEYFAQMGGWMRQYDMNVFLSDDYRDINFARDHGVTNTILIPNGAGEDEFLTETGIDIRAQLGIPREHLLILSVGSHTAAKGHTEAMDTFSRARLKNATLLIVGNFTLTGGCYLSCSQKSQSFNRSLRRYFDHKQILLVSPPRLETVAAYQSADIFLFPSNIECSPIVLFECMASRTPFLTADVGNAAEITGWSGSGLVLPTVKDTTGYKLSHVRVRQSARLLQRLARDKEERMHLAEKGFETWKERFSWEKIAQSYESLYKRLLSS